MMLLLPSSVAIVNDLLVRGCVNRHVFEVDGTGNCNITSMECNDTRT